MSVSSLRLRLGRKADARTQVHIVGGGVYPYVKGKLLKRKFDRDNDNLDPKRKRKEEKRKKQRAERREAKKQAQVEQ